MVPHIILYDQNRADAALFAANDRSEIRVIQIPSFDLFQYVLVPPSLTAYEIPFPRPSGVPRLLMRQPPL